jgi:hypothetical protein
MGWMADLAGGARVLVYLRRCATALEGIEGLLAAHLTHSVSDPAKPSSALRTFYKDKTSAASTVLYEQTDEEFWELERLEKERGAAVGEVPMDADLEDWRQG